MKTTLTAALGLAALLSAQHASAQVTFYLHESFSGPTFTANRPIANFDRFGFNDRASSAVVQRGQWEVCEDSNYRGRCTILRPGQYVSFRGMGLSDRLSSARPVSGTPRHAYAPPPPVSAPYAYYPRHGERLYTANVTYVRAVVGSPQQRCWVEREQVGRDYNVPGAVIGGIVGGVLGHQIGGGHGQDVATALGAVGGAVVGSNVGRGGPSYSQDVRRCTTVAGSSRPEYWDVSYVYRGREHRTQLSYPPGPTIQVNSKGEPRA